MPAFFHPLSFLAKESGKNIKSFFFHASFSSLTAIILLDGEEDPVMPVGYVVKNLEIIDDKKLNSWLPVALGFSRVCELWSY